MQPQTASSEPVREQPAAAYAGNQGYAQQQYDTPYHQPPPNGSYDDNFVEALAQRIAQRTAQGPSSKIYSQSYHKDAASSGQRLGLAIVSIVMLVAIADICLGPASTFGGYLGFFVACIAIVLINFIFNTSHK